MAAPTTKQPTNDAPGFGFPQTLQPQTVQGEVWAAMPQVVPNCPPGLEYLTQIDQLLVHQKVELLEAFLGCETKNRYEIKNSMGQKVYSAKEENDCCTRNCCGTIRPFLMDLKDNSGQVVLRLDRPLRCQGCCFPCCLQEMSVYSSNGSILGSIEEEWSLCIPKYVIKNAAGDSVLRIEGPCCQCRCCADVVFNVLSLSGNEVGNIRKQWTGLLREAFTDADHFGITFPIDLDVAVKATLLGSLFLIHSAVGPPSRLTLKFVEYLMNAEKKYRKMPIVGLLFLNSEDFMYFEYNQN